MEERYYVLEKFGELERSLIGILEAMPIKRRAIDIYRQKNNIQRAKDIYSELDVLKGKLLDAVRTLRLLFLECDMQENADFSGKLYGAVKQFNLMTEDYTKLLGAVEMLKKSIPQNETVNASVIGHLMNNVKMGYYPTDTAHVKLIKNALKFPECSVNILDSCCGCGLALETLAMNENAVTFGMEIDEARGREAEGRLDRVGFGSFFHSRVSHEAFHALFLNPPYLSVMGEGGTKARSEKRFLVESLHHLMPGGVLMYIIPYYRLTYDICRVLCDNFENISVYRFLDNEFSKFKQIIVFGVKKGKGDGSDKAELLSQYAMLPEKIPVLDTVNAEKYSLPDIPKTVELFKGAVFNLGELQRQLAKSKSIGMLFEKSRIDAIEKRPLLPLNVGQVGLIGGSGLINGYVDCDNPHVIKGRVIKEVKRRENEDEGTLTETRVNRMLFNILTPEGMKKLA
ncbi:MAG: hypothetical protein BWY15_01928 [Firmicutes bacterium ADurb.Bin193]|nr:MAG: hypothetical protein BWY15_01928 [Firmicutes bacterium ADurb.Bin193]